VYRWVFQLGIILPRARELRELSLLPQRRLFELRLHSALASRDPSAVARASIALKHHVTPLHLRAVRAEFALSNFPGLNPWYSWTDSAPAPNTSPTTTTQATEQSVKGVDTDANVGVGVGVGATSRRHSASSHAISVSSVSSRGMSPTMPVFGHDSADPDAASPSAEPRPKPLPEFLCHSAAPRLQPLTKVPQRLYAAASTLSRNLLGAMGDRQLTHTNRLSSTVRVAWWVLCVHTQLCFHVA